MKNFIQEGCRMNYTNAGSAITSGDVVVVGKIIGIAVNDIAASTGTGVLALEGVFQLAKTTSLVITQGDEVFWNTGTAKVTKTVTDVPLGVAWTSQASNDTTVQVRLVGGGGNGVPVAAVVAALGTTSNLTAAVVAATTFAGAACAGGSTPTATNVNTAIDAATAAVKTALDLKADNVDLETLRTETEARLDAIEAKVDAFLASLKAAGLMATS
jgi:predicted RecA/RadA family phage recombinase